MPAAPYNLMGYSRQLFIGTADGSTSASTRVENCLDITVNNDRTYDSTKKREDGSTIPVDTEKAVSVKPTITWSMNNEPNDAQLTTIRAAARSRTADVIAIVVKERDSTGAEQIIVDGDFNIKCTDNDPLSGASTFDFEATPSRDFGRVPSF